MFNAGVIAQPILLFLFLNVFAALLLHLDRLPGWLIAFSVTALVWRLSMFSGRFPKPNWLAKLALVCGGFYGIYFSYGANLTIESMVSLLLAGVMLKPLEVEKQQHSYVLIFLNYFLCALLFLFDRTPLDFVLVLAVMLFTLASQVLVHLYDQPNRTASVKTGLGLLLKSLPLAVILFLILPRLGPLWTLSIPTQSGVVGLSDSMSPGSIAQLGENDELAFRVKLLEGELPMNQRYWRAFALSDFDGETWQQGTFYGLPDVNEFYDSSLPSVQYEVMIEPHEKNWLFAVGAAKPLTSGIHIQDDATLESKQKLYNQWQYRVQSNTSELITQSNLSRVQYLRYTRLPKGSNPRAQAFAKTLKQESNNTTDFIRQLRHYISNQEFNYTLSPGEFDGRDQIDDFLFDSKSGFCSYYAGSIAFLLRSVGVPTRIVLGYMGGENNELSQTLSVYQYDAHAWVEVFFDGQGWVRIDPTAWVAPERVESGLQRAIPNEFKGFNSQAQWLKDLRKQWQAFDYLWNEWMLSYKGNKQQAMLDNFWGERSANEIMMLLLGVFALLGLGLFAFLWWDQAKKPKTNEQKIFDLLFMWLMSTKVITQEQAKQKEGLTLKSLIDKLKDKYQHLQVPLDALSKQINQALYQSNQASLDADNTRRLIKLIHILKKQTS